MSKNFDPQQQVVLDSTATQQLVSASAGSGKTTVMIQKITDLLLSKIIKPEEMLVVTFTNLASLEMRQRLIANLNQAFVEANTEEQKLDIQNMLDTIQTASIDTIDGFCSKTLKKYFYQAGLNPDIKIISSFSQEYYINKALDLAIEQYGNQSKDELIVLCDIFEKKARSLTALKESLLTAFKYCICQKDYQSFLSNTLLQYENLNSPSALYVNNYICENIKQNVYNALRVLSQFTDYPKLHSMVDSFCSQLVKLDTANSLLDNAKLIKDCPRCNFNTVERVQSDDFNYAYLKFNIDNIKSIISSVAFLNYIELDSIGKISKHLTAFIELLNIFISTYNRLKEENGVMDFSDLERKMLLLLQNKEVAQNMEYKYIFVDEYQDINPMQDELISALHSTNSNLFLVGDVKQSIYGFRQSTPQLFIDTYKKYKQNEELGRAFDMNINFRSAPQILKFNNEIFSYLMTEKEADIDYASTGTFEPRRQDFPNSPAVEIEIANTDTDHIIQYANGIYSVNNHIEPINAISAHDIEARIVVNKIHSLVGTEFYDSALKQNRILEFKDIAILTRSISNDHVQNLANLLNANNIPINISRRTDLSESEGLAKILSILRALNYTASDIDYAYLFTSSLVGISYNELLSIYIDHNYSLYHNLQNYIATNQDNLAIKIKYGFNLCDELNIASATLNIVELVNLILNKYHLREYILASEKGFEQLSLLEEFLNSLSIEEKNLSITKFIDLMEKNLNTSKELVSKDSLNSVTIQTIHASKGLEYPVVILFNTSQQFKYITEHNDLNFDLNFGIGMQYYDLTARRRYESPTSFAIKLKNKEKSYKEELRLLYVATTRAKNKLIITGCCSEDKLKSNTLSKDNYLHLILSVYYNKINTQPLATEYKFSNCIINIKDSEELINTHTNTAKPSVDTSSSKALYFAYPHLAETNISIKNNVTALSRTLNEEHNIVPIRLNINENLQASPDDLAMIGTQYHAELSLIDYRQPYNYTAPDNIDQNLIKMAYDTISKLATNCMKQHNEKQFMMYVPYNSIYTDSNITTKILVQGVVDLILEFDSNIILIDYKYSNSSIHNLVKKYTPQIMLYKMAIEKAFKKPVSHAYIYSIKSGEMA